MVQKNKNSFTPVLLKNSITLSMKPFDLETLFCLLLFPSDNLFFTVVSYQTSPAGIYLFKVNSRNTRKRCEICSKLTINTPERRQWRRSGVFIVNFEHISHLVLVFLLLTLSR